MPTSTEQIAKLIASNDELKGYFEGVRGAIDRKVADADKRVDGFIAGARNEYPAINIYTDPLYKNSDTRLRAYNPRGHSYTSEIVAWDYNHITREIARQTANLNADGKPRSCGLIVEAGIKMLKVVINRKAGTDGYILMYPNPRRTAHIGRFTFITGAVGVLSGQIKMGTSSSLSEGQVAVDYGRQVFSNLWGWHHLDVVSSKVLSSQVEFYIYLPVLATGVISSARYVTTMDF